MANLLRGQVPFKALDRDLYIQYTTTAIAEVQAALGFRRPDPLQPDVLQEVDEQQFLDLARTKPKLDNEGRPVYVRRPVLLNANERQRRMVDAFEACLIHPDPAAAVVFFRAGLKPWLATQVRALPDGFVADVIDALGLQRIQLLHADALAQGVWLAGREEDDDQGKAQSAA